DLPGGNRRSCGANQPCHILLRQCRLEPIAADPILDLWREFGGTGGALRRHGGRVATRTKTEHRGETQQEVDMVWKTSPCNHDSPWKLGSRSTPSFECGSWFILLAWQIFRARPIIRHRGLRSTSLTSTSSRTLSGVLAGSS